MEVTWRAKDEAVTVFETRSCRKALCSRRKAGGNQRTTGALDRTKKTQWRVRDWAQTFSPSAIMEVRS